MKAPETLQRIMNSLLEKLLFVMVYLDSVVSFSSIIRQLLKYLKEFIFFVANQRQKVKVSKPELVK